MPELTIRKLHPVIGAEVTGVDFREPIGEPTREALSRALSEHLALVFPGQDLTPEQYLNAGSAFGPLASSGTCPSAASGPSPVCSLG